MMKQGGRVLEEEKSNTLPLDFRLLFFWVGDKLDGFLLGGCMKSKAVLTKWFFRLIVVWFVLSIFLGMCFEMLDTAAPFTASRYLWVGEYIENYARFSWVIFFNLLEMPIFLFLLWKYGVGDVVVNRTARFALGAVVLSSLVGLLGLIEVRGNGAFSRLVHFLMRELDWLGASFFFFLIGYSFVVSLVLLLKYKRGY